MQKFYLIIGIFTLFITSLIIGFVSYRFDTKKNYSFLNMFPFEMKSEKNGILTLIFRIFITLTISLMCVSSLVLLFFNDKSAFLTKSLSVLLIFTSIIMISLFIISFKSYNNHILSSSIFSTFVLMCYVLFGYITIRKPFDVYYVYQTILSFIGAGIILLIMIFPPLANWYKVKRKDDSKNNHLRNRFNLLSTFEWLSILLFLFLFLIISLSNI